jgi:hypothetical protein
MRLKKPEVLFFAFTVIPPKRLMMIHTAWANKSHTVFCKQIYAVKRGYFLRI